jgi:SnoaL-like polyketide cyclase
VFSKEKREARKAAREHRAEVKADLKEKIKPRPTFAQRQETRERKSKREERQEARRRAVAEHLEAMHAGAGPGDVVQLGASLIYLTGLSAVQFRVMDQLANKEDKTFTRWTVRGRHDKEFLGMAPTNRDVEFGGVSISVLNGDVVTQETHYWDMVSLLQQIQAP